MKSDCGAKSPTSIQKIGRAFEEVKIGLGASPGADWKNGYYQAANRIATLHFLQREGIPARMLFIYFLGDHHSGMECPGTEEDWKPAIAAQWEHLGLPPSHRLADRIHGLFLPISEPLP